MLRLLNIRDYEICQSCATLKEQLSYERSEKDKLTSTLLNILSPKVVEAAPIEINPTVTTAGTFARRRAALEAKDREESRIINQSTNIGKPDILKSDYVGQAKIENLEAELGIEAKEI